MKLSLPQNLYDNLYNMPAWQKAVIFILSMAIPVAIFWYLFLSSAWGELDTIEAKIPRLRQEIAHLKAQEKTIPELEKELALMKDILKKALKLLPEKEDIPSILTEVSSLGNEARLNIESFTPLRERKASFYAAIPFSMQFSGPFHNTVKFFDHISKMARIVHIKDVSMGNPTKARSIQSKQAGNVGSGGEGNSQSVTVAVESATSGTGAESATEGKVGLRGGTWIINTSCTGETYRFLTPEEQAAARKHKQGKKKKR
jgi:type IV pilus assembly protein PilO